MYFIWRMERRAGIAVIHPLIRNVYTSCSRIFDMVVRSYFLRDSSDVLLTVAFRLKNMNTQVGAFSNSEFPFDGRISAVTMYRSALGDDQVTFSTHGKPWRARGCKSADLMLKLMLKFLCMSFLCETITETQWYNDCFSPSICRF